MKRETRRGLKYRYPHEKVQNFSATLRGKVRKCRKQKHKRGFMVRGTHLGKRRKGRDLERG
jgi:hypothetical protein